jgi:hypothetical protein
MTLNKICSNPAITSIFLLIDEIALKIPNTHDVSQIHTEVGENDILLHIKGNCKVKVVTFAI